MCLYGDLAYPLRVHLQTPFHHLPLTPLMEEYNKSMSEVRIAVEWLFGDVINSFKFLDFKKNLKIGLSSVGKMLCAHCFAMLRPAFMAIKLLTFLNLTLPPLKSTSSNNIINTLTHFSETAAVRGGVGLYEVKNTGVQDHNCISCNWTEATMVWRLVWGSPK